MDDGWWLDEKYGEIKDEEEGMKDITGIHRGKS